ncbi:DUF697 domain-containing protein [Pseudorhodoplanes sp.]|uniref:DUF697 domain-containing protein n=1 Tax=Pseudorhodoplanes sp. TaxID=1934341 RepID=UPI002B8024A6|nr:DUF697 domain-containing protein [Pseudorhodoplanes sp.]HWV55141.1 DUF697 domain-containing protein [Pseudorhodoplanes sp.]
MTRKQLPKAIKPAGSGLRFIPGEAGTEAPMPQSVTAKPTTPREPVQVEAEIWPPTPPAANANDAKDAPSDMQVITQSDAEMRLQHAFKIVDRHKMYAGLGGLLPMAAVNVAGVTAVILRMVKTLSDLYGIPFERDKTRSIVIGLMGGAAPTGLAAAAATTLSFAAPIAGAVGLAVSSVAAAALTRRIGLHFVERFETEAILGR